MAKSTQRPLRIPDDPWYPAVARAKSEDRTIGQVVTMFLRAYAAGEIRLPELENRTPA